KPNTQCHCFAVWFGGMVKVQAFCEQRISMNTINHWINNAYTEGAEDGIERAEVTNPASGKVSGQVAMGGQATVDEAVAAAKQRFRPGGIPRCPNAPKS